MTIPNIHLAIMQPLGYVHSLGFLDQARYFRWQFRRLGANVTLAKNRLRQDAVNFVFGAHLGLPQWPTMRASLDFTDTSHETPVRPIDLLVLSAVGAGLVAGRQDHRGL